MRLGLAAEADVHLEPISASRCEDARMTYAVLFKIYFVDPFVLRQLDRLKARVASGDVFVIADETDGELGPIPHDKVIRVTESEMRQAGFENGGSTKAMFWHNADYSLYSLLDRF